MKNEINKANDLFQIYMYNFLEKLLQIAVNEEDQIDNKIKKLELQQNVFVQMKNVLSYFIV